MLIKIATGTNVPRQWRQAYDIVTTIVGAAIITLDDPIPQKCPNMVTTQQPVECPTTVTVAECPVCTTVAECPPCTTVAECPSCTTEAECPPFTTVTVPDCAPCTTSAIQVTTPTPRACSVVDCDNGGSCVDHLDAGFHCDCLAGFADQTCSTSRKSFAQIWEG